MSDERRTPPVGDGPPMTERLRDILGGVSAIQDAGAANAGSMLSFLLLGLEIARRDWPAARDLADELRNFCVETGGEHIVQRADAQTNRLLALRGRVVQ